MLRKRTPRYVEEPAAWSAFGDRDNPYGFVMFDVDPGHPGGETSIDATYFAIAGPLGTMTPVDRFTLRKPRRT